MDHPLSNIYYPLSIICRGHAATSIICGRDSDRSGRSLDRSGFTLIELLVVMGIMVLATVIVVSSSFGMSRASGYIAARNVVHSTLQNARQRACTHGKRVLVAFVGPQEDGNSSDIYKDNSFVLIEAAGFITDKNPKFEALQDRTAHYSRYSSAGREDVDTLDRTVWNLHSGGHFRGGTFERTTVNKTIPGTNEEYAFEVAQIRPGTGYKKTEWALGDPYGYQISDIQYLPGGFKFGLNGTDTPPGGSFIVFEPDGGGGFVKSSAADLETSEDGTLYIYEDINKGAAIKIEISGGKITLK